MRKRASINSDATEINLRKSRYFQQGKDWYYRSRELGPTGPFESKTDAMVAFERFRTQKIKKEFEEIQSLLS